MGEGVRVLAVAPGDEMMSILAEAGCTATRAGSWRHALAAVEGSEAPPDLMVTPWTLGEGTDGLRLHCRVAERTPGVASLILFRPEDVERMPDAPLPPGVRLLRDPCEPGQLLSAARDAVAEARALRAPRISDGLPLRG